MISFKIQNSVRNGHVLDSLCAWMKFKERCTKIDITPKTFISNLFDIYCSTRKTRPFWNYHLTKYLEHVHD